MFRLKRRNTQSPSVLQLVRSVIADGIRLVRSEIELVKARFTQSLKRAGIGIATLLVAAALALFGAAGLLAGAGLALAIVLPGWAAALIVAVALLLAGGGAARLGIAQLQAAARARSSGPVEVETELREMRYRLEADLEALSSRLDPRHHAHDGHEHIGTTNGRARTLHRSPR